MLKKTIDFFRQVEYTKEKRSKSERKDTMEFEKIRDIIAEQFGVDADSVTEDTAFKDLGDSMDMIELIMAMEEEFDMEIEDEDADKIRTVGDALEYIRKNA